MLFRPNLICAALASAALLSACAPLLLGGAAVSGALMATDRRTSGAQVEDQAIELKGESRLRAALGDRAHLNVTSYNRIALITGEVANETDRQLAESTVQAVENVKTVVNEAAVAGLSSLTSRTNDTIIGSKVKASFVDAKDLQANSIKVVGERGIIYLMGRVTEREAARAAEVARGVSGVQKVVRVFEIISEAELKAMQPEPKAKPVPQPAQ
jgi:osmotically-inducible protein OsmY